MRMKARIKYKTPILAYEYTSKSRAKSAFSAPSEIVEACDNVIVVDIDKDGRTVRVLDPLDPDKVITIAAEAVEIYNEAVGIWQQIVGLFQRIGGFFSRIFKKKA